MDNIEVLILEPKKEKTSKRFSLINKINLFRKPKKEIAFIARSDGNYKLINL